MLVVSSQLSAESCCPQCAEDYFPGLQVAFIRFPCDSIQANGRSLTPLVGYERRRICFFFEVSGVPLYSCAPVLPVLALQGSVFCSAPDLCKNQPSNRVLALIYVELIQFKPNKVAIGESTCGAKWFSGPLSDDCDECNSMFDISELSRVALERASTAR